jgi:MoaA/NifB/PqqE/SkfB family radical SAM enzyme
MIRIPALGRTPSPAPVTFLELEITGWCPAMCDHCVTKSGPSGFPGTMTTSDWERVLAQTCDAGITSVRLTGGDPLQRPGFARLLRHALGQGLGVEIVSHLDHRIPSDTWSILARPGVSLAVPYYSDDPTEHDRLTGHAGSHARTLANIAAAVQAGVPVLVGIIDLCDKQRTEQARDQLIRIGVGGIRIDRIPGIGDGSGELCCRCGDGRAAISSDGDVWPCILSRGLPAAGNVKRTALRKILAGPAWRKLVAQVRSS